jgi:hypothetical protein
VDRARQIRLLVPPFFFLLSLAWIAYIDRSSTNVASVVGLLNGPGVVVTALSAGAATLPLGFAISSISTAVLRLWFKIVLRRPTYEARVRNIEQINKKVNAQRTFTTQEHLFVIITFDHHVLPRRIHLWLQRRWNNFNLCLHSITGIVLGNIAAPLLGIDLPIYDCRWWAPNLLFLLCLGYNARISWKETMDMLDFQADQPVRRKISRQE